jgi:hypothetical protein
MLLDEDVLQLILLLLVWDGVGAVTREEIGEAER